MGWWRKAWTGNQWTVKSYQICKWNSYCKELNNLPQRWLIHRWTTQWYPSRLRRNGLSKQLHLRRLMEQQSKARFRKTFRKSKINYQRQANFYYYRWIMDPRYFRWPKSNKRRINRGILLRIIIFKQKKWIWIPIICKRRFLRWLLDWRYETWRRHKLIRQRNI